MSRAFLEAFDKGNVAVTGRFAPVSDTTVVVSGDNGYSMSRVSYGTFDVTLNDTVKEIVYGSAEVMLPYAASGMDYTAHVCADSTFTSDALSALRIQVINGANGELAEITDAQVAFLLILRRKENQG